MSGWLLWPQVAAAAGAVVAVATLLWRATGARRNDPFGWAAAAIGMTLLAATGPALLLGLPDQVCWLVVHPVALALFAAAFVRAPGAARPAGDWAMVLLDGWVLSGGMLMFAWLVMQWQQVVPVRDDFGSATGIAAMVITTVHVLAVTLLAGQLARVTVRQANLSVMTISGLGFVAGDVAAAVADRALLGVPLWLAGALGVAVALNIDDGGVFRAAALDAEAPRRIRFWQLPILPASWFILSPGQQTTITRTMAYTLMIATFGQIAGYSRQNAGLWRTIVQRTRRLDEIMRDSRDVLLQLDRQGVVEFASEAAQDVLGLGPQQLVGTPFHERLHPDDFAFNRGLARTVTSRGGAFLQEARFRYADREWRYIEWTLSPRADEDGWVLAGRDIAERVRLREELAQQSRTDPLTGLVNRSAFLADLDARLATGRQAAVLVLGLDNFKAVNDTLGQAHGDDLLRRVAAWLRESTTEADVVARLGGDEFGVLCSGGDVAAVERLAAALVGAVRGVDAGARGRQPVSGSVGIAPGAGERSAATMLRDADLAMYRAKRRGGSAVVVFEPWMSDHVIERSRQREELETVVHHGGLAVHMQPVVDLETGAWTGFEALVRWPVDGELRPPSLFLPLAEETGLIVPMGTWVLVESLRLLAQWQDPAAGVAVNVSALQLVENDFPGIVLGALEGVGIDPRRLTLEITEQAAVHDLARTASRLAPLREHGVHVAVDDFGTGYSSLQYLSRLPVDVLKIDRRFVAGLGQDAEDEVLVRSMIRLAGDLDLEVIAEGVETVEQAELLRGFGCRLAQGFLFARPGSLEDLAVKLAEGMPKVPRPRGTRRRAPDLRR